MVPAGWDVSRIRCSDPSGDSTGVTGTGVATYKVSPGETVHCVFTNTKRGMLVVEKQTEPDGDPATFAFSGAADRQRQGRPDADQRGSFPAPTACRRQRSPGWDLRTIQCDDPTGDSTGDASIRTATFRVGPGETVKLCLYQHQAGLGNRRETDRAGR